MDHAAIAADCLADLWRPQKKHWALERAPDEFVGPPGVARQLINDGAKGRSSRRLRWEGAIGGRKCPEADGRLDVSRALVAADPVDQIVANDRAMGREVSLRDGRRYPVGRGARVRVPQRGRVVREVDAARRRTGRLEAAERNQPADSHLKQRHSGAPLPSRLAARVIGFLQRGQKGMALERGIGGETKGARD